MMFIQQYQRREREREREERERGGGDKVREKDRQTNRQTGEQKITSCHTLIIITVVYPQIMR